MTQAVANILAEVERLSPPERANLADRLVEMLTEGISPQIERAHLEEVRRRDAEIDSGEVIPISAEEALERVRRSGRGRSACPQVRGTQFERFAVAMELKEMAAKSRK